MTEENDNATTDSPAGQSADSRPKSRRKLWLIIVAVVAVVLLVAYGCYWLLYAQYHESTKDAYVHGNIVAVSPQVRGTVVSVNADNTDLVHAGDVLVRLDDSDAKVALQRARASLADTVRKVQRMFDEAGQMQATVALRKASMQQAQRDYQRAGKLEKIRGISTEDFQHARTQLQTTRAGYQQARHKLAAARSAITGTTVADHPMVKQAEAELRKDWLVWQRTKILAPVTGYIAQRHVQVGQQVKPGSKLMAVIPLGQVWVAANYKETDLINVRIGQPVAMTADLYGGYTYHGHVAGLAAGTGNAFSLLPAQNATGNWIKVVQRVPVRVALDPDDLKDHPLRIGLSMEVNIDTHNRTGRMLANQPASGSLYQTAVYQRDSAKVDTLIHHIVQANKSNKLGSDPN